MGFLETCTKRCIPSCNLYQRPYMGNHKLGVDHAQLMIYKSSLNRRFSSGAWLLRFRHILLCSEISSNEDALTEVTNLAFISHTTYLWNKFSTEVLECSITPLSGYWVSPFFWRWLLSLQAREIVLFGQQLSDNSLWDKYIYLISRISENCWEFGKIEHKNKVLGVSHLQKVERSKQCRSVKLIILLI